MAEAATIPGHPGDDEVGRAELATTLGITEREITNLIKAHPEFPSVMRGRLRVFPRGRCVQWYVRFKSADAVRRAKPAPATNVEDLRNRREGAETRMAEMDLAEREGELVAADQVDRVVGEVCDRLRAVLVNIPGNYGLRLEELGVDPAKGEAVLSAIVEDLTRALRATADDVEAMGEDDGSDDSASPTD